MDNEDLHDNDGDLAYGEERCPICNRPFEGGEPSCAHYLVQIVDVHAIAPFTGEELGVVIEAMREAFLDCAVEELPVELRRLEKALEEETPLEPYWSNYDGIQSIGWIWDAMPLSSSGVCFFHPDPDAFRAALHAEAKAAIKSLEARIAP